MSEPIRLFFDFASPYAYFVLDPLAELAARHGRTLELRPILLWAVFKGQGVGNPLEKPARRAYFDLDVPRSAAFHGVPFRMPDPLQISAHLAARLHHAAIAERPDLALPLARDIFRAFFVDGLNIADRAVLADLPSVLAFGAEAVQAMIDGADGRGRLAAAIEEAAGIGVIGSPYAVVDGEGFFGADRLPQIDWRLGGGKTPA